jgi:hypothetical protein
MNSYTVNYPIAYFACRDVKPVSLESNIKWFSAWSGFSVAWVLQDNIYDPSIIIFVIHFSDAYAKTIIILFAFKPFMSNRGVFRSCDVPDESNAAEDILPSRPLLLPHVKRNSLGGQ